MMYLDAQPFPHVVIHDHWPIELLEDVVAEFPQPDDSRWHRYDAEHERKLEGRADCWGDATRELLARLAAPDWTEQIESLTGIPDITIGLEGAGMHMIEAGGYLDPHVDFNRNAEGLHRRINVLIFLNHDWDHDDGGELELWDDDGPRVVIPPVFNTTVVFSCSRRSWHGHPRSVRRLRRSIAAYYFSPQPVPDEDDTSHSTIWRYR